MCTVLVENGYDFDELRRSMTDVGIAFWREQLGPAPTADLEEKRGLVLKQTVREGRGPVLPASAFVRYHYSAWLERSPLPFDSTVLRSRNRPPAIRFSPDNGSSISANYLCTTTSNALLAIALAFFRWLSYSHCARVARIVQRCRCSWASRWPCARCAPGSSRASCSRRPSRSGRWATRRASLPTRTFSTSSSSSTSPPAPRRTSSSAPTTYSFCFRTFIAFHYICIKYCTLH